MNSYNGNIDIGVLQGSILGLFEHMDAVVKSWLGLVGEEFHWRGGKCTGHGVFL